MFLRVMMVLLEVEEAGVVQPEVVAGIVKVRITGTDDNESTNGSSTRQGCIAACVFMFVLWTPIEDVARKTKE